MYLTIHNTEKLKIDSQYDSCFDNYEFSWTWAAQFPDLLTQEKENILKDSTKVLILLITLLIVQSEGKLEDRGIYAFLGVTFKDNLGPSFKGSILNNHMRVHH